MCLRKDIVIESLENKLNDKSNKNTVKCSKCDFEGSKKHGYESAHGLKAYPTC